jgi:hypothetical protein
MPRVASWSEVRHRFDQWSKRDTFDTIACVARDFFTHLSTEPVRVQIFMPCEAEYDDEGGSFLSVYIKTFEVFDARGESIQPHEPNSDVPIDPEDFQDSELRERLLGLEWDIRQHFYVSADRCVVNLLEPPPEAEPLWLSEEVNE